MRDISGTAPGNSTPPLLEDENVYATTAKADRALGNRAWRAYGRRGTAHCRHSNEGLQVRR